MGWLIYLSGVVFVFGGLYLWNWLVENSLSLGGSRQDKEENKVSLWFATIQALLSWVSVLAVILFAIVTVILYGLTETTWSKKANDWFTASS